MILPVAISEQSGWKYLCDSLNLKSRKMAERLGFELEAVPRSDDLSNDRSEYRDTCLYAAVF